MSFEDLYESCFRNAAVIRVPKNVNGTKGKSDDNTLTTLDHVMSSSRYVIFFIISSNNGKASELIDPLKGLVEMRNESASIDIKSSPARFRRFFSVGRKSKKKKVIELKEISVVVFDVDMQDDMISQAAFVDCGWHVLAPMNPISKSRLLRALRYVTSPSLVVVDSISRSVIANDGRRMLQEDPAGTIFPWTIPSSSELFSGSVLSWEATGNGEKRLVEKKYDELAPTVKGLYFAANWCPPCRAFTKQLISCYESLRSNNVPFEIFFCSSDRSKESFEQHFSTMPWIALPFDQQKLSSFTRYYCINGIPAFLIVDEENRVITRHGRSALLNDPNGKYFPWRPQPMYELKEHIFCRLRDEPSLVLFTEGTPEDVSFSIEVLKPIADALYAERMDSTKRTLSKESESQDENLDGNNARASPSLTHSSNSVDSSTSSDVSIPSWADPLQIFFTGEDPICDVILEGLGLGNAELPIIVIIDVIDGRMGVCDKPDVSGEIISQFISEYRAGRVNMVPLPSSCQASSPTQVGGIPIRMIHQALGIGTSPSQNSIIAENGSSNADTTILAENEVENVNDKTVTE
ncbi:hypothetical protein AB6A40_005103 [Gnathostoma spinigerum]|uniref:Thioredoxin-like fold domain-containing protein n=1 Tax=Gnathostoma spinigerum TaxID=75299 RepID=A0ABD6EM52_9BILA